MFESIHGSASGVIGQGAGKPHRLVLVRRHDAGSHGREKRRNALDGRDGTGYLFEDAPPRDSGGDATTRQVTNAVLETERTADDQS